MLKKQKPTVITEEAAMAMFQRGSKKLAAGEYHATFDFIGCNITLLAVSQDRLRQVLSAQNIDTLSQKVEEMATAFEKSSGDEGDKEKLHERLNELIEDPFTANTRALAAALAQFVKEMRDDVATASMADGNSYVSLGWLVELGAPMDGYIPEMADHLVKSTPSLAEDILFTSAIFRLFVQEKLTQTKNFLAIKQETELGNSDRSQTITSEEELTATSAEKQNSKSSATVTKSCGTKAAQQPSNSSPPPRRNG